MQIHEITRRAVAEGFMSDLGRELASRATGIDIPQSQASINQDAANAAKALKAQGYSTAQSPAGTSRIVVSLMDPQQNVATKYYKVGNTWTNEIGGVISSPKSTAWLDGMIATTEKENSYLLLLLQPKRSAVVEA